MAFSCRNLCGRDEDQHRLPLVLGNPPSSGGGEKVFLKVQNQPRETNTVLRRRAAQAGARAACSLATTIEWPFLTLQLPPALAHEELCRQTGRARTKTTSFVARGVRPRVLTRLPDWKLPKRLLRASPSWRPLFIEADALQHEEETTTWCRWIPPEGETPLVPLPAAEMFPSSRFGACGCLQSLAPSAPLCPGLSSVSSPPQPCIRCCLLFYFLPGILK